MKEVSLVNLVCLPFAGAGASVFHEWKDLSDKLNVIAVQLPGREKRFVEPAYTNVAEAVQGIMPELMAELDFSKPIVFFGHSLGAVLAFELARAMCAEEKANVQGLIVSGSPSPWNNREERASGLPDDEFVRRVNEFAGYSHPALEDPIMREVLLPTLRADVEMHESYHPLADDSLPITVLTIRGSDDELVTAEDKALWSKASSVQTLHEELPGGHMYLMDDPTAVIALIESAVL
ncbi:predicted thioesterase involved in non-ribosomal peptide biosynthesis [Hahella chejuensis KCTC 2396]|uniref:Predicted thioesterase involved in non-ribosomal peptide biosynthesis n=1 Tax=Hahella chejuensis (strain KCTC 2396) TaxID=349521 RepID=Q2SKG3_HAHCH|nr:alpha/beta fold hydrolase [Hahella chejuensis]ABC28861.1 predicted thioesterase involved in non-ribosomal peptide biosynthesis [Hahella chejuensis KCTC 2396]